MSEIEQVTAVIERCLAEGETRRDVIRQRIACEVDFDPDALRRLAARQRMSLALARMRDDNGERLAFPSENELGEKVVVHLRYTNDPWAMHRAGVRMERSGLRRVRAGKRLQERAIQLGLFDRDHEPTADAPSEPVGSA